MPLQREIYVVVKNNITCSRGFCNGSSKHFTSPEGSLKLYTRIQRPYMWWMWPSFRWDIPSWGRLLLLMLAGKHWTLYHSCTWSKISISLRHNIKSVSFSYTNSYYYRNFAYDIKSDAQAQFSNLECNNILGAIEGDLCSPEAQACAILHSTTNVFSSES